MGNCNIWSFKAVVRPKRNQHYRAIITGYKIYSFVLISEALPYMEILKGHNLLSLLYSSYAPLEVTDRKDYHTVSPMMLINGD